MVREGANGGVGLERKREGGVVRVEERIRGWEIDAGKDGGRWMWM